MLEFLGRAGYGLDAQPLVEQRRIASHLGGLDAASCSAFGGGYGIGAALVASRHALVAERIGIAPAQPDARRPGD